MRRRTKGGRKEKEEGRSQDLARFSGNDLGFGGAHNAINDFARWKSRGCILAHAYINAYIACMYDIYSNEYMQVGVSRDISHLIVSRKR